MFNVFCSFTEIDRTVWSNYKGSRTVWGTRGAKLGDKTNGEYVLIFFLRALAVCPLEIQALIVLCCLVSKSDYEQNE